MEKSVTAVISNYHTITASHRPETQHHELLWQVIFLVSGHAGETEHLLTYMGCHKSLLLESTTLHVQVGQSKT